MSADSMIAAAEKSLGLGEPNYIQVWYRAKQGAAYAGNFPWCDAAITYWAWQSGNQDAVTFGGYYAYTVAHANAFKAKGLWHVDVADIKRGDIVFFDWGKSNSIAYIDHVGIVTGVKGPDIFTIEGNSENVCARRVRQADTIAGYGRPAYVTAPLPPPPPPPAVVTYEPFPGKSFFYPGKESGIIVRMAKRLVEERVWSSGFPIDMTWGPSDKTSYQKWQQKLGYSGTDADGIPGKTSWDKLKVPRP